MVPNGWKISSVSEICKLQNGNSFKPDEWDKKGLPIIRIQNLNGSKNFNYFSGVPQERWLVETGDLLFSWAGTKGVSFGPFIWKGERGVLNQHIYKVSAKNDIDHKWLFYVLKYVTVIIEGKAHGFKATLLHVKKQDIDDQVILLPPISEQQKIAKILSTWDKAISTTERLIENSSQQKKALMQQLLTGKKRLLDESGKRFEGEWEDVKLSAIVKVIGGNAFKSTDFKDSGIPLIKISNIKPDYSVSIESSVFISLDQKYDKFQIKNGDVLIAMSGATTGKIGRYASDEMAYLNQRVGRFAVRKGLTINSYLFQLLKLPKVQHEILIDAVGGAQPNISNKDIERIKVSIPPIKEQQKVATVLTNADKEIELLKQQLSDLQQEKKALMQVLLTGKKRVVVDEC